MGPEPWALSPLVSTMPHLIHTPAKVQPPSFPSRTESIGDDVSTLVSGSLSPPSSSGTTTTTRSGESSDSDRSSISSGGSSSSLSNSSGSGKSSSSLSSSLGLGSNKRRQRNAQPSSNPAATDPRKRRAHFSSPSARKLVQFGPGDVLTTDFCYGFLAFPQLALNLPGGLSFDLTRYWDGQPVRFVCCERPNLNEGQSVREAKVFWCVAIESVED